MNEEFKLMKELLQEKDQQIRQLDDEKKAMKFNQNRLVFLLVNFINGDLVLHAKKLIEKCKILQHENEELGTQHSEAVIENYKVTFYYLLIITSGRKFNFTTSIE